MISLKSPGELEVIGRAGAIVAEVHALVERSAVPGTSTGRLDRMAEEFIRGHPGAVPAFKGLYGFPATLCTSIDDEVVHGIPSERRVLADGDILSVDVGVRLEGFYADAATTMAVGEVGAEAATLLEVTRSALEHGIAKARVGGQVGDIGAAVEARVGAAGFSVIRELVGHGVGHKMHEEPQVPNYGTAGQGRRLQEGLVIAIEPMVNVGDRKIRTLEDEWTVVTADGSLSAHFEHTVAVMREGPTILTARPVGTAVPGEREVG